MNGRRRPPSFDQACQAHGIEHRLIKPERPQTNGIVERFSGRISDVLVTRRYTSGEDLEQTLKRCAWLYNHHHVPSEGAASSITAAMKEWQTKRPEIFTKRVIIRDPTGRHEGKAIPYHENEYRDRKNGVA